MKYFLTYHAIERLKERFPILYTKNPELKAWKKDDGVNAVKKIFDKLIEQAEENRSYINNTTYMLKLYDKYGYDVEYCFKEYKEENILFIFTKNRSEVNYKLVTLMPTEYRPTVKNLKYNEKQTKEDKHNKLVMDFYNSLGLKNKQYVMNEFEIKKELPKLRQEYEKSQKIAELESHQISSKIKKNHDSLICSQELSEKIFDALANNKASIIKHIASLQALYQCVIEDKKYEFIYKKAHNSEPKSLSIISVVELSKKEKEINQLQSLMTPELKKNLLTLVYDNATISEKISNTRSMHTAQYNGFIYDFLVIKTSVGERNVILQKSPELIASEKQLLEDKKENITEQYTEIDTLQHLLTPDLKEKLVTLIFSNQTNVEKISNSRSLHSVDVDGMKYSFLAIKKVAGDRNIILQNPPEPLQTKQATQRIKM